MKTVKKFLFCLALTNLTSMQAISAESYAEKVRLLQNGYLTPYVISKYLLLTGGATLAANHIQDLYQEMDQAKKFYKQVPVQPPKIVRKAARNELYKSTIKNIATHACLIGLAGIIHSLLLRDWINHTLPEHADTQTLATLDALDISQNIYATLAAFGTAAVYNAVCQYLKDKAEYYESLVKPYTNTNTHSSIS